ncbi:hypothetical protein PFLmoz3_00832 [Pseudomonas fluorescens]|uniref:Uncharacterized protein n=1 Tax=Pseudomonas fluorescens TaxID=294 RepID=A0A109LKP0_PSEFL|nr:hypothetical protein PFLmoz3_00832 [Pseudomonas fluorescens]
MLGAWGFQVPQGVEVHQLAVFDRAGRCGEVGAVVFQRRKAGAGTVGRHLDGDRLALACLANHALLIHPGTRFSTHILQALILHQAFDQRRAECRADGVGALDAQGRALVGNGQRGRHGGECDCKTQEQNAQHHAGTFLGQRECHKIKSVGLQPYDRHGAGTPDLL